MNQAKVGLSKSSSPFRLLNAPVINTSQINSTSNEHFLKTETENESRKLLFESRAQLSQLNVDPRSTTYAEATLLLAPYRGLLEVLTSADPRK